MKRFLTAGAVALSASLTGTAAFAQSTTVPGEQVGLAVGAPLPEGVYAIDTFIYRSPDAPKSAAPVDVSVNVPVLVWSTPWAPLGGRIELVAAFPTVFAFGRTDGPSGLRDTSINVGTLLGGIWAFDLGGNFGVSFLGAVHLNDLDGGRGVLVTNNGTFAGAPVLPQLSSNTYRVGFAGSYTGDGWDLTANLTYNFYDSPGRFDGPNLAAFGNTRGPFYLSDALLLDLTATKKFDLFNEGKPKFEIGAIGYGVMNLSPGTAPTVLASDTGAALPGNVVRRDGRFALGGLIGYDFGSFTVQAYVARDVVSQSYYVDGAGRRREIDNTEGWFRTIVPLYTPPKAEMPALVRKY